jgi:hypothetical protein
MSAAHNSQQERDKCTDECATHGSQQVAGLPHARIRYVRHITRSKSGIAACKVRVNRAHSKCGRGRCMQGERMCDSGTNSQQVRGAARVSMCERSSQQCGREDECMCDSQWHETHSKCGALNSCLAKYRSSTNGRFFK